MQAAEHIRADSAREANRPDTGGPTLRWRIKKMVRAAFALVSLGTQIALPRRRDRRVRILTYHRFGNTKHDAFCVGVEDFERQMAWLARENLAISLADFDEFLAGRRDLPRDAVLVSIDDGNPCLFSRAMPIAERHGIPLLAFVPAGEVAASADERGDDLDGPQARITSMELTELVSHGVAIGSHAYTHRSLARLPPEVARTEVEQSRAALEAATGQAVRAFAYPFGTRADYNDTTTELLRSAGFQFGFTSQHGAVTERTDPLALPRVKVEGGEDLWMFRAIVRGGMDGWRWIDRFFWRLQAVP